MCERSLDCGNHQCELLCHEGACTPCDLTVERVKNCPCSRFTLHQLYEKHQKKDNIKEEDLREESNKSRRRNSSRSKKCENEVTTNSEESCKDIIDENITTQFVERKECTDPIPTCGSVCGKNLLCGKPGSFHSCSALCHAEKCPPCPQNTPVRLVK